MDSNHHSVNYNTVVLNSSFQCGLLQSYVVCFNPMRLFCLAAFTLVSGDISALFKGFCQAEDEETQEVLLNFTIVARNLAQFHSRRNSLSALKRTTVFHPFPALVNTETDLSWSAPLLRTQTGCGFTGKIWIQCPPFLPQLTCCSNVSKINWKHPTWWKLTKFHHIPGWF